MTVLILAEPSQAEVKPATLSTITAARAIGGDIHVLVAGAGIAAAAEAASRAEGVAKVLAADDAIYGHALPETIATLVASLAPCRGHVLAPATTFGKNVLPRAAALLDVAQISDIIAVVSPPSSGLSTPPTRSPPCATQLLPPLPRAGVAPASSRLPLPGDPGLSRFLGAQLAKSERPELSSARIVVSGGRGLGSGENFKIIEALADKLGAAVGTSRAAVDAGFVPNDLQVGQTGKAVAPELYIAIGISGAIQHLAGMKDSKVIVAINKDAVPSGARADQGAELIVSPQTPNRDPIP
jgi:electron transfer flavoprotein alpha subunit